MNRRYVQRVEMETSRRHRNGGVDGERSLDRHTNDGTQTRQRFVFVFRLHHAIGLRIPIRQGLTMHTRSHFLNQTYIDNVFEIGSNGTHLINDAIANHVGPFCRFAWRISLRFQNLKHHLHTLHGTLPTTHLVKPWQEGERKITFIATFVTVSDNAGNSKCSESMVEMSSEKDGSEKGIPTKNQNHENDMVILFNDGAN